MIDDGLDKENAVERWVIPRVHSVVQEVIDRLKTWAIMRDPYRSSLWMAHGPSAHVLVRILENIVFEDEPVCTNPFEEVFMVHE